MENIIGKIIKISNMRTKTIIPLSMVCAAFTLASCHKDEPVYNTSHPDHGTIALATDWSNLGETLTAPAQYTVKAGDFSATLSGTNNRLDYLFEPSTLPIYV